VAAPPSASSAARPDEIAGGSPPTRSTRAERHRSRALFGAWTAVVVMLAGALAAGVVLGPAHLPVRAIALELAGRLPFVHVLSGLTAGQAAILWQIRLPRVVLGLLVGSMLSLAGAAYQGVFRNPLADPYLLGAAAGAGLGATLVITAGIHGSIGPFGTVQAAAFAGALAAVTVTWLLGRGRGRVRSTASLILAGVAVTAQLTAKQT
jgi:iron complex transport system permease protein